MRNSVLLASRHRRVHRPTSPAVGDVAPAANGAAAVASGGGTAAGPDPPVSVAPSVAAGTLETTGATSAAGPAPATAPPPAASEPPPAASPPPPSPSAPTGTAPSRRPLVSGGGTGSSTLADATSIPTPRSAATTRVTAAAAATPPPGRFRFVTDQGREGGGGEGSGGSEAEGMEQRRVPHPVVQPVIARQPPTVPSHTPSQTRPSRQAMPKLRKPRHTATGGTWKRGVQHSRLSHGLGGGTKKAGTWSPPAPQASHLGQALQRGDGACRPRRS